ncbi:MAG: hypothetical protein AB7S36_08415, partial [Planctomycetota bacterium]
MQPTGDEADTRPAVPLPAQQVAGANLGLHKQATGQWHLRMAVAHELNGVAAGQGLAGAGIADACLAWIAAEPAQFAGLSASSLQLKRLHPIALRPIDTQSAGLLWSVEFEPMVGGRPIDDSVLQFMVEDRASNPWCVVRMLLGRFWAQPGALAAPQLSEDDCRTAAAHAVGTPLAALRIVAERHVATIVEGTATPFMTLRAITGQLTIRVNELTGAVTTKSACQCVETVTVKGRVEMNNHTNETPDVLLPNVAVVHGGGTVYTNASGVAQTPDASVSDVALAGKYVHMIRLDGAEQSIQVNGSGEANFNGSAEFPLAEQTIYFHADSLWTWLSTRIETAVNDSLFDTHALEVQVNDPSHGNAYFTDYGGELAGGLEPFIILFSAGSGYTSTAMSDVIYHEYGHYVDWCMGGFHEQGGLSEGWGDLLCAFRTDDSKLAEGIFSANNNALRDCNNNTSWVENHANVHTSGTAFAGFAWAVRASLKTLLGAGPGAARAEEIFFAALEANTTSVPDTVAFVQMYDAITGGTATTQGYFTSSAANHALSSYTAPAFRITGMTCDVGLAVQGVAADAHIAVTVQNTSIVNRQITVAISGTDVGIANQMSASLTPGQTEVLNFTWPLGSAPAAIYTATATATVAGLGGQQDTRDITLVVAPSNRDDIFFDDMESGMGKWTTTGTWATEAANAVSGANSLSDTPGDIYDWDHDYAATTQSFSLVGYKDTQVSLWVTYELEDGQDYVSVEMSDGGPWMTLQLLTGFNQGTYHVALDASYFDGKPNVKLRLRLWSDYQNRLDGIYADDIRVFATPAPGNVAAATTTLAFDGFESNNLSGGTGWSAAWTTSGSPTTPNTGPANGSRHARLLGNSSAGSRGSITRFANINGQQNVRVQVLLWLGDLLPTGWWFQDHGEISLSDNNGSTWTPWIDIHNAHNSTAYGYHLFDIAIADLGLNATAQFGVRIRANNVNSNQNQMFVDDVRIYTINRPPVFDAIADPTTEVNQPVMFNVSATDPENDSITLGQTQLPPG